MRTEAGFMAMVFEQERQDREQVQRDKIGRLMEKRDKLRARLDRQKEQSSQQNIKGDF